MILKGESKITLFANEPYQEEGILANYHEKDVSNEVKTVGEVDTTKPGSYEITYEYTYQENKTKSITRLILVIDNVPPKIELSGKKEMSLYEDETYKEPGFVANDNVDKDITDKVKVEKQKISDRQYKMIYTVEDTSGNKAIEERIITIKKLEPTSPGGQTGTHPSSNNGVVYLTFDDGPSLDITPKILDILKEEQVKATFFILNYDANREVLVKRIVNEGHTIAIHGYSHDYHTIYQSEEAYMQNIKKLQEKIKQSTGTITNITRFPGGSSNTVSKFNPNIMTKLTKQVVEKGFRYYDWNVSAGDAGEAKTRDDVYRNVTKELSRNRSNVVLMHDFSKNTKTLEALRSIIQYGKQNGFTFDKITDKTPMVTHRVNN